MEKSTKILIFSVVMTFFFTAVASYIVGLVGNSNSPVSGMTISALLGTAVLFLVLGFKGESAILSTLGVAAVVCCAACTSGDVCNDLKTGQIVGSRPYRQQIMQIIGVGVASLVMAPILQLLHENTPGGIGGRELAAPQAGLFASLANGFFGDGNLPLDMVAIGAVLGILILTLDYFLFDKKLVNNIIARSINSTLGNIILNNDEIFHLRVTILEFFINRYSLL